MNFIFEHELYFFEHELNELNESWGLRNINLERIKRIIMNNSTGTRNFLRGSHTDLTDLTDFFKCERGMMRWKEYLDGNVFWKKEGIFSGEEGNFRGEEGGNFRGEKEGYFRGKPMVFLCTEMNIYAKQEEEVYKYPKQRL